MSSEGGLFETMAGRYSSGNPNVDVYLKGYSGDPLRVDRKSRPPEFVPRPALTLVLTVQPEVTQGLAAKPGFRGRGVLARFLYSLPQSMVGFRSNNPPLVPEELMEVWRSTVSAILQSPDVPETELPVRQRHSIPKKMRNCYRRFRIGILNSYLEGTNEDVKSRIANGASAIELAIDGMVSSKPTPVPGTWIHHFGYGLFIVRRLIEFRERKV